MKKEKTGKLVDDIKTLIFRLEPEKIPGIKTTIEKYSWFKSSVRSSGVFLFAEELPSEFNDTYKDFLFFISLDIYQCDRFYLGCYGIPKRSSLNDICDEILPYFNLGTCKYQVEKMINEYFAYYEQPLPFVLSENKSKIPVN